MNEAKHQLERIIYKLEREIKTLEKEFIVKRDFNNLMIKLAKQDLKRIGLRKAENILPLFVEEANTIIEKEDKWQNKK